MKPAQVKIMILICALVLAAPASAQQIGYCSGVTTEFAAAKISGFSEWPDVVLGYQKTAVTMDVLEVVAHPAFRGGWQSHTFESVDCAYSFGTLTRFEALVGTKYDRVALQGEVVHDNFQGCSANQESVPPRYYVNLRSLTMGGQPVPLNETVFNGQPYKFRGWELRGPEHSFDGTGESLTGLILTGPQGQRIEIDWVKESCP